MSEPAAPTGSATGASGDSVSVLSTAPKAEGTAAPAATVTKGTEETPKAVEQGKPDGTADQKSEAAPAGELKVALPEGESFDPKVLESFTGLAKDLKLDSEGASKAAAWMIEQQKAQASTVVDSWQKTGKEWGDALKKEFGEQWDAKVTRAQNAIERFGGQPLRDFLKTYGLSNAPELVRAFEKVGEAIGEDRASVHSDKGGVKPSRERRWDANYDHPDSKRARGV